MTSERSAPPDLERLFRPVPTGRMSEVIIEQVKEAIRDGAFKPGDRLPPERDLAERFNVSRMTIRDGLRVLETAGLVEIRVGAHGGAFVTRPGSGFVSEGLTDMLIMSSVSAAEITEARMIIELEAVRLACLRATDEDIDALAEICDRAEAAAERSGFSPEYSAEFHSRLSRATHNQVVSIVVEALHDPVVRSVAKARHAKRAPRGRPGPDPYAEAQLKDHRLLVEAVRARDADRAREIMTIHLRRTADQLGIAMETKT
jgi:DNA-binding FadR family transcriptional regulator